MTAHLVRRPRTVALRARFALGALTVTLAFTPAGAAAQGGGTPPAPEVDTTQTPAAAPTRPVRRVRQSWISDRRHFAIGDLITVRIDEWTAASAQKRQDAVDRRQRDMNFGLTPPGATSPADATSASAHFGNDGRSETRGDASRQTSFTGEMSVRVIDIDEESGLLQVEGTRLVDVDKNKQQMTVTGWLRPQDVSAANVVTSSRMANAEITYAATGQLGKPKGGIIGRIIGAIWP